MHPEHHRENARMSETDGDTEHVDVDDPTEPEAPSPRRPQDMLVAWTRREILARPGSFAVDLASLVAAAWAIWWFADNDGGLDVRDLWPFSLFLLVLLPLVANEWRRVARPAAWLLAALPLGGLVSLLFAVDRSLFPSDAIAFAGIGVIVLMSSRLARRQWTAATLFAIILVGFLSWSWLAGLRWWGWTDIGAQPRWELVSWRNPSGILSAGFGVWAGGMMLAGKRSPSLVAGAFVALGLAGAWLSSSRAAIAFGAAGLLTITLLVLASTTAPQRARRLLSLSGRLAGVAAATVAMVALLQMMLPPTALTPLASRGDETVTGNAITRTKHWEAAAGMFFERPLTGNGIGSYRAIAVRHNPPDGRLTSAAHSEWIEGLAEGGLALGIPLLGLAGLFGIGVFRSPRHLAKVPEDAFDVQRGFVFGAVGAASTILAHASIDFDLRYPSILALAAVGAGVLLRWSSGSAAHPPDEPDEGEPRRLWLPVVALPTALLMAVGVWGARTVAEPDPHLSTLTALELATLRPPWDTVGRVAASERLVDSGELDAALVAAQGPATWNPGDPRAWMNLARVRYVRGEISGDELLDLLELPPTALGEWSQTAVALFEGGDLRQAELAARQAIAFHPEYRRWGIAGGVATGWSIVLKIAVLAEGCDEGAAVLQQGLADNYDSSGRSDEYLNQVYASICPGG